MADFESFASFNPSFSLLEMESGVELMHQFPELNTSVIESPSLAMMRNSNQNLLSQQPPHQYQPPASYVDNFSVFLSSERSNLLIAPSPPTASIEGKKEENNKRRAVIATPDCASGSYSTPPSENGLGDEVKTTRRNSSMKGKKGKCNAKQMEKPKEVIHVRARRGQATDSHSLAERVRREKINERMRCLQDLVPGCYKAMGMAVMLDEIINYVQSLQNQVEFLSMKLSAASSFYDFNLDMDALEMPQVHPRVDKGYEGQEVDSVMREGHAGCTSFHSILPF